MLHEHLELRIDTEYTRSLLAYVRYREGNIVRSIRVGEVVNADFDANDDLIGIELLDGSPLTLRLADTYAMIHGVEFPTDVLSQAETERAHRASAAYSRAPA